MSEELTSIRLYHLGRIADALEGIRYEMKTAREKRAYKNAPSCAETIRQAMAERRSLRVEMVNALLGSCEESPW